MILVGTVGIPAGTVTSEACRKTSEEMIRQLAEGRLSRKLRMATLGVLVQARACDRLDRSSIMEPCFTTPVLITSGLLLFMLAFA